MKVLQIINNLSSGGAEKLIETIVPIMKQIDGVQVEVLLLTDRNNVFDKTLKEHDITISVVPIKRLKDPLNIFYIRKFIIEGNFDIVHAHLFPTNYWTSIVSKLIFFNKPLFLTTEHSTHNRRRNKWYFRKIEKVIYNNYNKIISISRETQDNLMNWLEVKSENIKKFIVIENGIDIERFKNAKPYKKCEIKKILKEDNLLLCMVGRFTKQKDHPTIIKAMKELPENVHLLLIGEGELKVENEKLVDKLKLNERVHFLGFRRDVERILKTVDILVLSSYWEGFGLAAVEGMAAGKPVIATNVPGLSEVVGGAGLTFEVGNVKELKDKIMLLQNKNKYNSISQKCLRRANNYNINNMVEKYIAVYKNMRAEANE